MAFCPKILGGGGDLQIINLLKNECTCEVVGTLNHYKMVKNILNFVHLEVLGT